jgi:ankyrin repeat protein
VLQKRPPPELEEGLLHKAVADRKKSHVKLLLDKGGEDLEALNKKGETVLFKAVSRGDKGIVQLLLDNNANPLARPEGSDSPLHLAIQNDKKTILKMLLEKSTVGIEETNSKGETPLYVACRKRQTSCIEVLLDHGANPNARPLGQESMLNMSVTGDYKSIAKLLLQIGVDIEERNKNGETVRIFQVNSSTSLPRAAEHESPLLADPVLSVLSEELC